jgi:hypothetical protein
MHDGHSNKEYPAFGGFIAAFSDGSVTNGRWRCTAEIQDNWATRGFDDSHWPLAVEQDESCCPWRDPNNMEIWQDLSARWIWTKEPVEDKQIYCRYTRTETDKYEVPDGSSKNASSTSPPISILGVKASQSQTVATLSLK